MDKEERKKYIFAQLSSLPNANQYVEVTNYIEHLEQQCEKQKEIINKAIEYVEWNKDKAKFDNNTKEYDNYTFLNEENINDLLEILKEV